MSKIEPGMLCWVRWTPVDYDGPGDNPKGQQCLVVRRYGLDECLNCGKGVRWEAELANGQVNEICECVLIPIPPDEEENIDRKEKECIV